MLCHCVACDAWSSAILPILYDYLRGGPLGTQHKHGAPPCILLGEAGVGKTSAMCHVTCRAAATGAIQFFFM